MIVSQLGSGEKFTSCDSERGMACFHRVPGATVYRGQAPVTGIFIIGMGMAADMVKHIAVDRARHIAVVASWTPDRPFRPRRHR